MNQKNDFTPVPTPRSYARLTGTPDTSYNIEFNGENETGFKTPDDARIADDEIERGQRQIQQRQTQSGNDKAEAGADRGAQAIQRRIELDAEAHQKCSTATTWSCHDLKH